VGTGPPPMGQDGPVQAQCLGSLFVMSTASSALFMIDVQSGNRVIVSK